MKIWTSEHTFNHPWETVAQAAWRKYPNPMNPAVLGTDVVDRHVANGVLYTHRLVSSKWGIPGWAQRSLLVGPSNICYASEQSLVNPSSRHMELKTRNLTFGRFIAVDETLSYQPHPEDRDKTLLKQEAVVTVQGIPLNSYMEDILTNTIMLNANKGRQAIEWVIDIIEKEVADIKITAAKGTDELKKSLSQARKSMDEFSTTAKKTLDDIHSFTNNSSGIPEF
uniref:PRELI/MSF1 domain-containing protein n=1 Tax=Homalodisca liturata TaxID=320908 RepID=A0A1B6J123_9HEMI